MRSAPARGRWAEDEAVRFLVESCGYKLEARNVRLAGGEIDLIVHDGKMVVFVEVKARRGAVGSAASAVTADKRRRLSRAAALWLAKRGVPDGGCRFDVVAVEGVGVDTKLHHFPNAFESSARFGV